MPRALRIQDPGFVHHVVSRGNNKEPIFHNDEEIQTYLTLLEYARKQYPIKIYNYVLMDNHIHLLLEPQEHGAMSKFMEFVQKEYAKYYNKRYNRVGHVFQGRYKSFLIEEARYFFACMRYIDLNPSKAGIVEDPNLFSWSGHRALTQGKFETLLKIDLHKLYEGLGSTDEERRMAYRGFVMVNQDELDLLNRKAGVLGSKEFRQSIKIRGVKGSDEENE